MSLDLDLRLGFSICLVKDPDIAAHEKEARKMQGRNNNKQSLRRNTTEASTRSYGVKELAELAGTSERTLRFYDKQGLLCPKRQSNGYRSYGPAEVDRLQEIMLYRELEVPVKEIAALLDGKAYSREDTLLAQRARLENRKAQIDVLLATIDKTLRTLQGGYNMSDKEKFDGFVQQKINENEEKYGAELRQKFGDEVMDKSNATLGKLDKKGFEKMEEEGNRIYATLATCMQEGAAPSSDVAQKLVGEHYAYLQNFGDFYTKEVYAALGSSYACDQRFVDFYDTFAPGLAVWLKDAIEHYCYND